MPRSFRITYNAPVILTFALAAVLVHILGGPVKEYFVAWPHLGTTQSYVGLFAHILGHGNWEHLLGNFTMILLLGPLLEERHGSGSLLIMILITALVTGLVNALLFDTGLLGASGIVFMLILLASTANIKHGEIPLTFIAVALIYLGGEVVGALREDNISQMAHLVGGLAGAAFGFVHAKTGGAGSAGRPLVTSTRSLPAR